MQIQLSDHFTYGRLLRFVFPSILTMFFSTIYSIVDAAFVSNFVGKTSFAAVNLVMPVLMLIAAPGVMMGAGGSALTASSEALALPLAKIFGGYDPNLFEMIRHGIVIYSFAYLLMGANYAGSSFFTALNNGLVSAIISFLRTFVFEIIAVLALPIFFGLDGIWSSCAVAEIASFAVTAICVVAFRKKYGYC